MAISGAPLDPSEDPQYLAFQRALGVNEDTARAQAQLQKSQLQRAYLSQLPQIQQNLLEQNRGVDQSFLARGIAGAGEQAVYKTENVNKAQQAANAAADAAYGGSASLDAGLAQQIAAGRQQQAELGLTTRTSLATEAANAGV